MASPVLMPHLAIRHCAHRNSVWRETRRREPRQRQRLSASPPRKSRSERRLRPSSNCGSASLHSRLRCPGWLRLTCVVQCTILHKL